jgi:hypothetical protein
VSKAGGVVSKAGGVVSKAGGVVSKAGGVVSKAALTSEIKVRFALDTHLLPHCRSLFPPSEISFLGR